MPNALDGFVTVTTGVFSGLIIEVLIKGFVDQGLIPSIMVFLFQLFGILALTAFVHVTKYWGRFTSLDGGEV